MIKISFVIPAFNEEAYIGKCLESVTKAIAGRWDDFEIIVVNNASTDRTHEVALSYSNIKLIDEPRKGLSQARQSGFEASKGELIANVDADCLLPQDWIGTVLENFNDDPELVALSGPQIFYDVSPLIRLGVKIYYYLGYFFIFRTGTLVQGGNFVVRRLALEKIGGYNPAFTFYGEDTDIAKRLNQAGKVKFTFKLPMPISGRRVKQEGFLTMAFRYPLNYIWTYFFGKPFNQTSQDIRSPKK